MCSDDNDDFTGGWGSDNDNSSSNDDNFTGGWSSENDNSSSSNDDNFTGGWSSDNDNATSTNDDNFTGGWSNHNDYDSSNGEEIERDNHTYINSNNVIMNSFNTVASNTNTSKVNLNKVPDDKNNLKIDGSNLNKSNGNKTNNPSSTTTESSAGGCGGCLLIIVLLFIFIMVGVDTSGKSSDGDINSTIVRTKLDSLKVVETGYYSDELGWVKSPDKLVEGMETFYSYTGVQPILMITDNIGGNYRPSNEEVKAAVQNWYGRNVSDQGHIVVVFIQAKNDYGIWIYSGKDAAKVMDEEARRILKSNIEYEYNKNMSGRTAESIFSTAFADTGEQIMTVNKHQFGKAFIVCVIIFVGVLIILVLLDGVRGKKK